MGIIDKILSPFQVMLKKTLEGYIRLETADNATTMAASDGSSLFCS